MNSVYTKAIAAFFGAGVPGGLAQLILYLMGVVVLPPDTLQSIITGIILGAVAAVTVYFSPANTLSTGQVVAAAKAGELTAAMAGVESKADAAVVAKAVSPPVVKAVAEAQETLAAPVPVPGGDEKLHASTMQPVKDKPKPKSGAK